MKCKLVLFTNRKLYTDVRLVPKSATLNDLNDVTTVEMRYYTKCVSFKANCVRLVNARHTLFVMKMWSKESKFLVIHDIWCMAILAETTENVCVKERHPKGDNLSDNWKTVRNSSIESRIVYGLLIGSTINELEWPWTAYWPPMRATSTAGKLLVHCLDIHYKMQFKTKQVAAKSK